MTIPDNTSMRERSTTVRFCRWLFSWRGLRRLLILLAWLVTLLALFHAEETWRGRRTWNHYRRQLEAKGEQLDFAALVPKPVPDEQNFAAAPAIKAWFEKKTGDKTDHSWNDPYERVAQKIQSPHSPKDARFDRRLEDLPAWAKAFAALRSGELAPQQKFFSGQLDAVSRSNAAPAVLAGLETNAALFAELRAASQRPDSRYPVNYDVERPYMIPVPHLAMVKGVCQRLQLKTCAELAGGQSEQALEDLKLIFRLADSVKEEPFLISYVVRLACGQLALQPIWEGLAEHRWSDAQLQQLETRFQQDNFIADLKAPLYAAQAAGIAAIELVRKKGPGYLSELGGWEEPPGAANGQRAGFIWSLVVPQGWYDLEEYHYCRGFQLQLATALDPNRQRVSPTQVKADAKALDQELSPAGFAGPAFGRLIHHRIMAAMLLPALQKVLLKAAAAQTAFNQAAVACALERYRLANGRFPEQLGALAPRFMAALPNDVLTGEPYKYRLKDDGRFVLYSIGWDEKDDGGVPGKTLFDDKQGDWVWEYPAK